MSVLLFMAHPGHELTLLGYVERTRPIVCVLTDGSGGSGAPRLARTRDEVRRLGCRIGPVFGAGTDRELYEAILTGDAARFLQYADVLASLLVREACEAAVGDPLEGYNPVHDIARYVLDAACESAREQGWNGASLTYSLQGGAAAPLATDGVAQRIELDEAAYARKLEIAGRYLELSDEVAAARATHGADAFRTELLHASTGRAWAHDWGGTLPHYEAFGRERVAAGRYATLITWAEHVAPIARAMGARAP